MTDNKRFHSESNCIGYYTEIIDEQKKLDLTIPNPKKNLLVGELVDLLNALYEENEYLQKRLQINNSDSIDTLNDLQRCRNNSIKAEKTIDALVDEKKKIKSLEDANEGLTETIAHLDVEGFMDDKN